MKVLLKVKNYTMKRLIPRHYSFCVSANGKSFQFPLFSRTFTSSSQRGNGMDKSELEKRFEEQAKVLSLIKEYQATGHLIGKIDPLNNAYLDPGRAPFLLSQAKTLQKEYYGFSNYDLDRYFYTANSLPGFEKKWIKLGDLLDKLTYIYSGTLVTEYSHMVHEDAKKWMHERIVNNAFYRFEDKQERCSILQSLLKAQLFEEFCGKRFSGAKRFSLEGSESLIPGLLALFENAAAIGVEQVELGMTHRGRLNVLRNVLDIPMEAMLANFQAYLPDDDEHPNNSDDVRYHLGTTRKLTFSSGHKIRVSLAANPSHLEAINSVVLGKTRARQFLRRGDLGEYSNDSPLGKFGSVDYSPGDSARQACMAVLLHGDASFYQGTVRESLGFSTLRDYTTGGTIHVVVNNQIGFTTMPKESHSSVYCTDVAKSVGAPVFHVNGDDPEKVVLAFKSAIQYRQTFMRDCVVNLWSYRRHGHNEQDKPELTQPIMYSTISSHKKVSEIYADKLLQEEVITQDELRKLYSDISRSHMDSYNRVAEMGGKNRDNVFAFWNEVRDISEDTLDTEEESYEEMIKLQDSSDLSVQDTNDCIVKLSLSTGVNIEMIRSYGRALFTLPPPSEFRAHPKVEEIMKSRLDSVSNPVSGASIQWAAAEALAFASLLVDGYHIRLSGQDVERGTFNQRHAVLYDQERVDHGEEVIYKPWTALQSRSWHRDDMRKEIIRAHSSKFSDRENIDNDATGYYHHAEENRHKLSVEAATAAAVAHRQHAKGDVENQSLVDKSRKMLQSNFKNDKFRNRSSLGVMEVCNSPLSEEAVLGFEHGYSLYSPNIMTIWEAQFGDFANCAQTIIDTFISSGEEKWVRPSGLVMLLPHGYEGQGPDHSSARLERFLQLCAEDDSPNLDKDRSQHCNKRRRNKNITYYPASKDEEQLALAKVNMHVLTPSTPAQYFHALRRQMILPVRKPLVIMTPKSLLHHKPCASALSDMAIGSAMLTVIDDPLGIPHPKRVVLCSGKLYYYLCRARKAFRLENEVSLVRIEQLCPFPYFTLEKIISQYLSSRGDASTELKIVWAQEEPKNMGAWYYVEPRFKTISRKLILDQLDLASKNIVSFEVEYRGRPVSASPATGSFQLHGEEMKRLAREALIG